MSIKLRLPLRDIFVTQPYGVNYFDFYQKMGLPYHPGVDFRAYHACKLYAAASGVVVGEGLWSDGGIGIDIQGLGFKTFYYHLKETYVKVGDIVKEGDLIGLCDNTGKYTTADHLHFELRVDGKKIDPAGFFYYAYDGTPIGPADWDKSKCYHRYYRGRPKGGYANELKILGILSNKFIKPTNERINALVYGSWSLEMVMNPAMYEITSQLTRGDFEDRGLRPFK